MRVAVVGAGFAGLSIAWHLIDTGACAVTVFDPSGIGGGASGIAAGLMHPYPGEQGRRSFLASEGMTAAKNLLRLAQEKSALPLSCANGILRYPIKEETRLLFLSHAENYEDIEPCGESAFLIRSGMTVYSKRYLQALWLAIEERGASLVLKKVNALQELASFDHVVLAAGAGITAFPEAHLLGLELLKGQILTCRIPETIAFPLESLIGKGYIAHTAEKGICHIGSTYERRAPHGDPDLERAKEELIPKARLLHPEAGSFEIIDCHAAFRVMRIGHYYPMAARLKENVWICTALGSRGLLYHGLLGELIKEAVLENKEDVLPKEFTQRVCSRSL